MLYSQFIANGIITGAYISLVAAGFSLIYTTNRFAHFAHGAVLTAGAYLLYSLFVLLGFNFYIAAVLVVPLTGLLGLFLYLVVYKHLRKKSASSAILLIASLALMILIENILLAIFGPGVRTLAFVEVQKGISIFDAVVTPLQLVIVGTSFVLLLLLWFFIRCTKLGKLMRAVSDNPELASISGINTGRIQALGFFIGSCIAGVAAILVGLEQNLTPFMGTNLIIKGFAGAVIGGIHSLPGAVFGSFFVGMAENVGIIWLPSGYKEAIVYGLLLLFLILRPRGIFGVNRSAR